MLPVPLHMGQFQGGFRLQRGGSSTSIASNFVGVAGRAGRNQTRWQATPRAWDHIK